MRFGDALTAVASLFLVTVLISALGLQSGPPIGASISVLIGALLIGYVFSGRMTDSRRESIVKISVLFTILMLARAKTSFHGVRVHSSVSFARAIAFVHGFYFFNHSSFFSSDSHLSS